MPVSPNKLCVQTNTSDSYQLSTKFYTFIESKDVPIALTGGSVSALNQNIFTSFGILYEQYLYLLQNQGGGGVAKSHFQQSRLHPALVQLL